jgi:hypothetical protein
MSDLFESPVIKVEHSPSDLNYQITDAQEAVLAHVSQVAGAQPRRGLGRMFSTAPDTSRAVVQVAQPDGTPLFFVDRAEQRDQLPVPPPCAIVAPGGQLIGRFEFNTRKWAQSHLEGQSRFLGGVHSFARAQLLFDAYQRQLCDITWEKTRLGILEHGGGVGGRYCTFTDMNGVAIAQLDDETDSSKLRFSLQLRYQLPEPLRTLVIAMPVGLGLWGSGG